MKALKTRLENQRHGRSRHVETQISTPFGAEQNLLTSVPTTLRRALSRREMLARTGRVGAGLALSAPLGSLLAAPGSRRIKIGACDWSLGKMATPACFESAKEIGLDGVQVSLGTASDDMKLRRAEVQQHFKQSARASGVEIASLAIGEMNNVPYKSDPRTEAWVSDSVEVMQALGVKVVLLAFFGKGDLVGDKEGTDEVIHRLKKVAPMAEKAGLNLGLESWLSAEETMRILWTESALRL